MVLKPRHRQNIFVQTITKATKCRQATSSKTNKFITINYLETKPHQLVFMWVLLSWLNWDLEILVFVEEEKRENLEKNARSKVRTNNKLKPY